MVSNKHGDGMIFPKGGWETDETAEEAAARETMEEAGVRGDLQFLGEFSFSSRKKGLLQGQKSPQALCIAQVFVMHVKEEMEEWPEQATRHRTWCQPREAVMRCKHEWMRDALSRWGGKFHPELALDDLAGVGVGGHVGAGVGVRVPHAAEDLCGASPKTKSLPSVGAAAV